MKREKDFKNNFFTRREFVKFSSLSMGTLTFGSLINSPVVFAKGRYPTDKITFIVPYGAGGGYDILCRTISLYLPKYLREIASVSKGGDIIIRNEPAAAGRKGRSMIQRAKPNGYTLGIMDTSTMTDNIIGEGDIDLSKFTFLQLIVSTTKVIVGSAKGFGSWNDVINEMKIAPVKMAVADFGRANHVSAIIMNDTMGTNFKLVNFPGTAQSVSALLRGDVQTVILSEETVKGLIDAKEVKVLLALTEVSKYPGAVTGKDLGFPELVEQMSSHRFIIAPPALEKGPKNILLAGLKKVSADREFIMWAKRNNVNLRDNIYGADAEKMFQKYKKFYEDIAPMLKKYLL